jgi:hypothetical protein
MRAAIATAAMVEAAVVLQALFRGYWVRARVVRRVREAFEALCRTIEGVGGMEQSRPASGSSSLLSAAGRGEKVRAHGVVWCGVLWVGRAASRLF